MEFTYQNSTLELSFETSGRKDSNPVYETWDIESLEIYKDGRDITKVVERLDRMKKRAGSIMSDVINEIYVA